MMSASNEKIENITCFICEEDLESADPNEIVIVTSRGIKTLIKTSLERKDGRNKALEGMNSITVHVKCKEKYTNKRNGKFAHSSNPATSHSWKFSPTRKKLRRFSDNSDFEFIKKCFICNSGDYYKQKSSRKIHKVTKPEFEINLRTALKSNLLLSDELSKAVFQRISCINLLAKKACYHGNCYNKILNLYLGITNGTGNVGRPKMDLSNTMGKINKYIEDTDDKVFTIKELVELTGK